MSTYADPYRPMRTRADQCGVANTLIMKSWAQMLLKGDKQCRLMMRPLIMRPLTMSPNKTSNNEATNDKTPDNETPNNEP